MLVDLRRRGLLSFNPAELASSDDDLALLLEVRQLDLSFNSLYAVRGLEGLSHLTVLNISHNGLRSLGGGLPLTLTELDASHNCLGTLQNLALLPLQFLTSLNVAFNELEDLRGVPSTTANLAYLDVRSNRLTALHGIEHCAALRTLHAEANVLREVAAVAALSCLPSLTAVFLSGNPLLLRKRLHQPLRRLLPPSVDQDDVPTTAPASSVRSSTAPPPSVPDTSSMCSLESSAVASFADDDRDAAHASTHRSGLPLSGVDQRAIGTAAVTAAVDETSTSTSSFVRLPSHTVAASGLRAVPSHASPVSPPAAAAVLMPSSNALSVVGGDGDSPTCRRRALPLEHRLGDSPVATASTSPPVMRKVSNSMTTSQPSRAIVARQATAQPATATTRGKGVSRAVLEEQLVRVMAERDASRREAAALRKEVADLQQLLATRTAAEKDTTHDDGQYISEEEATLLERGHASPTVTTSILSELHSATRSGITNTHADSTKDTTMAAANQRQRSRQDSAVDGARPSARVLAVEMSGHASSTGSEKEYVQAGSRAQHAVTPAPTQQAKDTTTRATTTTTASAGDRRAIAALFMSKLKNASAK